VIFSALLLVACGDGKEFYAIELEADKSVPPSATIAPPDTGDGWNTSTPAAEGLDVAAVQGALDAIRNGGSPGVDSLLIARHGRLVAEGYYNGYARDAVHDLRSAGKSFVSALAGIAIARGLFGLDDTVASLLPGFENHAHMDDRKRAITVNHLLNMRSGLECNDWDDSSPGHEERVYRSQNWVDFVLDLRMAFEPGTQGQYCTGGVVVLGEVISRRSGMGLDAFAQSYLFGPLRVPRAVWRPGPDNRATAGTGMRLRPRDLAKLGQLYLDDGAWNGVQVVPSAWVERSQEHVITLGQDRYGFLWWKRSYPGGGGQVDSYFAWGNGGNFAFVLPTLDLVVAFTGSNYSSSAGDQPFSILANRILPAVR
jgi:CubicO group peptidase (beta-lactamase class C family)